MELFVDAAGDGRHGGYADHARSEIGQAPAATGIN
jgi:hypothetical protein